VPGGSDSLTAIMLSSRAEPGSGGSGSRNAVVVVVVVVVAVAVVVAVVILVMVFLPHLPKRYTIPTWNNHNCISHTNKHQYRHRSIVVTIYHQHFSSCWSLVLVG